MEAHLDRLLAALLELTPDRLPEVEAEARAIQQLAAAHFDKEEGVFYPRLRPLYPDLLAQLDRQHEEVREVERHVGELLAEAPAAADARWLNELRTAGIQLHDLIQHHIVDEEDQLFRLAESRLSSEAQQELLAQFTNRKPPR